MTAHDERDWADVPGRAIRGRVNNPVLVAAGPFEKQIGVAFLATEAASYPCGQTIDVAGGQWMN